MLAKTREETRERRYERYLNSSEAERRTNKASGDKYSTSPGKLRQHRVYKSHSLPELRSFATSRLAGRCDRHETAPYYKAIRTRETNLEFTAIVRRAGRSASELTRDRSCLRAAGRGTTRRHDARKQSHDRIVRGDGKRRARGVKSRVEIIVGPPKATKKHGLWSRRVGGITIAKTCPNSGIREIRW